MPHYVILHSLPFLLVKLDFFVLLSLMKLIILVVIFFLYLLSSTKQVLFFIGFSSIELVKVSLLFLSKLLPKMESPNFLEAH